MPEISVKDQIKKLVDLQKIDIDIYKGKKDLQDKPAVLEELKNQFESKKEKLNGLEESLKAVQVSRKEIELELQGKEEDIAKANSQLSQLKTNKEYTAMLKEIESFKADKSVLEDKILQSYDEADNVSKEIAEEKKNLAEEEKQYNAKKSETETEVHAIEEQLKGLESQRNELTPSMDPQILAQYDRILKHKEGLAMVPVRSSACGGCFMNVTPQVINKMKMNDSIVVCETCTRILYLEEDL